MSHLGVEVLIELRDGEGSRRARDHLESCERCRGELEQLFQLQAQLRALPSYRPSRDRWPALRQAIDAERRRRRHRQLGWAGLAAASLLAAVLGYRWGEETRGRHAREAALEAQLLELREVSQLIEAELRAYRPESRVVAGWRAEAIGELEDRLQALDGELHRSAAGARSPELMVGLWQQRLELQGALYEMHTAPVVYRSF